MQNFSSLMSSNFPLKSPYRVSRPPQFDAWIDMYGGDEFEKEVGFNYCVPISVSATSRPIAIFLSLINCIRCIVRSLRDGITISLPLYV